MFGSGRHTIAIALACSLVCLSTVTFGCATDFLEPWEGELAQVDNESVLPSRLHDWAAARRGDHQSGFEYVSGDDGTWIGIAAGQRPSTGYEIAPQELAVVAYDTLDPDDDVLELTVRVVEPLEGGLDVFDAPIVFYLLTPRFPGRIDVEILEPEGT